MSAARPATILDAGVGNLGNLQRALAQVGATATITRDPDAVRRARCLLLPGVGAFRPPREALRGELEAALREALAEGAWLLGICVGFQLLFTAGDEHGETDGLGLLEGRITRLPADVLLPQIGWNRLERLTVDPLLTGVAAGSYVYFVHSYAPEAVPPSMVLAETTYGRTFPAIVGRGRVLGTQFHPEKSDRVGLRLLSNFLELAHGTLAGD
jgi:imidazole glycerol-phosphate synthase subunit HisH